MGSPGCRRVDNRADEARAGEHVPVERAEVDVFLRDGADPLFAPAPPIGNVGHPDLCQVLVVAGDITSHQVADFWGGSERRRLAQLPPYDVQVEDALPVEIALEIGDRLSRSPVACALDAEVAGSLGANRHPAVG